MVDEAEYEKLMDHLYGEEDIPFNQWIRAQIKNFLKRKLREDEEDDTDD